MHIKTDYLCEVCKKSKGLGNHTKCKRILQQTRKRFPSSDTAAIEKKRAIKIKAHTIEYLKTGIASEFLKLNLTDAQVKAMLTKE